jgi:hypothetical protein
MEIINMSGKIEDARGRRGTYLRNCFVLFLLLFGLCQTSADGGQVQQTVFSRMGEYRFATQDITSIKFKSDVYADLTIRCWERSQLHVAWAIKAASGKGGERRTKDEEPEATFEKEIKVATTEEAGVISVWAQANASRFSAVKLADETPGSKVTWLEDRVTGLLWSLKLTVFVPYGLRLDSRQFKGATFVACGRR